MADDYMIRQSKQWREDIKAAKRKIENQALARERRAIVRELRRRIAGQEAVEDFGADCAAAALSLFADWMDARTKKARKRK